MTRFDEPVVPGRGALRRIRTQPAIFVASTFASFVLVCLAVGALVANQAVRDGLARVAGEVRLSVFVSPQRTRGDAEAMRSRIESASIVARATLRTREEAWSAIAGPGLPNVSNRPNPLPDVWLVALRLPAFVDARSSLATEVESARGVIAAIPGVDTVSYDRPWVGTVDRWSNGARWLSIVQWCALALIASMLFCIFFIAARADIAFDGPTGKQAMGAVRFSIVSIACALLLATAVFTGLTIGFWEPAMQPVATVAGHIAVVTPLVAAAILFGAGAAGAWCGARRR